MCKFVYIFRTDENHSEVANLMVIIYILRMITTHQRIGLLWSQIVYAELHFRSLDA